MDWMTLAGTGLGAVVGVGSTLLVDRARWRRDTVDRSREERKALYVACLTALRQAHEAMRAVSAGDQPPGVGRDAGVREAFRTSGVQEARESAVICVSAAMVPTIDAAYYTLRDIRDVLAAGHAIDSPTYDEARSRHGTATRAARAAMRADLGHG